MQFQFSMKTTDGYDYLGESLHEKVEPFIVNADNQRDGGWDCEITTCFGIEGYHSDIRSSIELHIDHNTVYDYIGETVRDEIEDLIIYANKKGYTDCCMKVRIH